VQATDGTEAYTRAGAMDVNSEGLLILRNGLAVQGDGGPITVPANAELSIGNDGTVTAKLRDQGQPQQIGRIKMVTPEGPLQRGTDGLFRAPDGNDLNADPLARLQDGALEGSNVSAVETMVSMISAARQFEQQMKLLQIAQTQGQESSKLLGNS
jgi:flagellar basal-body rod protein FlgF